jgi:ABC-type transport system substrate-binding protein
VDLTVGLGLAADSVVEIRDRWREGRFSFEFSDQRWFRLDPQFIDPNPTVITDLRFRRALLHAIDRQEMADSLQMGLSPVAHTFMAPKGERIEVLTQINQHIFENLNTIGLYYFPTPYAIANRMVNIPTGRASRASMTWNAHLWEVRS